MAFVNANKFYAALDHLFKETSIKNLEGVFSNTNHDLLFILSFFLQYCCNSTHNMPSFLSFFDIVCFHSSVLFLFWCRSPRCFAGCEGGRSCQVFDCRTIPRTARLQWEGRSRGVRQASTSPRYCTLSFLRQFSSYLPFHSDHPHSALHVLHFHFRSFPLM